MYTAEIKKLIEKVEATRPERLGKPYPRMTPEEKDDVLQKYHPDYRENGFYYLSTGVNKGAKVPLELGQLLEANSRIRDVKLDLNK